LIQYSGEETFSLKMLFLEESNHRYSFAISNVGESANLAWKHIKTDLEMKKKIIIIV
jgi:hypothetical protein